MKSWRTLAGWLILAASLAVPALIAYNWWSRLNDESKLQMTRKIRRHLPQGEGLFPGVPARQKLVNPILAAARPSVSSAAVSSPRVTPAVRKRSARPVPEALSWTPPAPAAGSPAPSAAVLAVALSSAPAAGSPAPRAAVLAVALSSAPPHVEAIARTAITRDPTLSPTDMMELEQPGKALGKAQAGGPGGQPEASKAQIEKTIDLQGIISTGGRRNKAIVNGRMVEEGDSVEKAKIIRITAKDVIFDYKGRKFKKILK